MSVAIKCRSCSVKSIPVNLNDNSPCGPDKIDEITCVEHGIHTLVETKQRSQPHVLCQALGEQLLSRAAGMWSADDRADNVLVLFQCDSVRGNHHARWFPEFGTEGN